MRTGIQVGENGAMFDFSLRGDTIRIEAVGTGELELGHARQYAESILRIVKKLEDARGLVSVEEQLAGDRRTGLL